MRRDCPRPTIAATLLLLACLVTCGQAITRTERLALRDQVRDMFVHGWESYERHAFPMDELDPINCRGRGSDKADPSNININDVLGDFSLTLVDTLDTFAIMGNASMFVRAVDLYISSVHSFDLDSTVSVFESTIRVLGGLLSAHTIIRDGAFGVSMPHYRDELLGLAHDLGQRLLPAFNTPTHIPYPRVHLRRGVLPDVIEETCTAGAGTLLLEFATLSRLTGDPRFERVARQSLSGIWKYRGPLGLPGNVINIMTGQWTQGDTGVGAGVDSFFEYVVKGHILLGDPELLAMAEDLSASVDNHIYHEPLFRRVHMGTGQPMTSWIDSLSAYYPGLLVLMGDVAAASSSYETYYALWQHYRGLPERFDIVIRSPAIPLYPLRPELMESTWMLYRSTGDPYYLHAGALMVRDIEALARTKCGFATLHSVLDRSKENRMESFFLSETLKYLYLLFDDDNPLNDRRGMPYVITTEGHLLRTHPPGRRYDSAGAAAIPPPSKPPVCVPWRRDYFGDGDGYMREAADAFAALFGKTSHVASSLAASWSARAVQQMRMRARPLEVPRPAQCLAWADLPPPHLPAREDGSPPPRIQTMVVQPEQAALVNVGESATVVRGTGRGEYIASQLHNLRLELMNVHPAGEAGANQVPQLTIVSAAGVPLITSVDYLRVPVRPPLDMEERITRPFVCVLPTHMAGGALGMGRFPPLHGRLNGVGPAAWQIEWPLAAPLRMAGGLACGARDGRDSVMQPWTGAAVIIQRGECDIRDKVAEAVREGAAMVIIADMNNDWDMVPIGQVGDGLDDVFATIPSILMPAEAVKELTALPVDQQSVTVWPCPSAEHVQDIKRWSPHWKLHVSSTTVHNIVFYPAPIYM